LFQQPAGGYAQTTQSPRGSQGFQPSELLQRQQRHRAEEAGALAREEGVGVGAREGRGAIAAGAAAAAAAATTTTPTRGGGGGGGGVLDDVTEADEAAAAKAAAESAAAAGVDRDVVMSSQRAADASEGSPYSQAGSGGGTQDEEMFELLRGFSDGIQQADVDDADDEAVAAAAAATAAAMAAAPAAAAGAVRLVRQSLGAAGSSWGGGHMGGVSARFRVSLAAVAAGAAARESTHHNGAWELGGGGGGDRSLRVGDDDEEDNYDDYLAVSQRECEDIIACTAPSPEEEAPEDAPAGQAEEQHAEQQDPTTEPPPPVQPDPGPDPDPDSASAPSPAADQPPAAAPSLLDFARYQGGQGAPSSVQIDGGGGDVFGGGGRGGGGAASGAGGQGELNAVGPDATELKNKMCRVCRHECVPHERREKGRRGYAHKDCAEKERREEREEQQWRQQLRRQTPTPAKKRRLTSTTPLSHGGSGGGGGGGGGDEQQEVAETPPTSSANKRARRTTTTPGTAAWTPGPGAAPGSGGGGGSGAGALKKICVLCKKDTEAGWRDGDAAEARAGQQRQRQRIGGRWGYAHLECAHAEGWPNLPAMNLYVTPRGAGQPQPGAAAPAPAPAAAAVTEQDGAIPETPKTIPVAQTASQGYEGREMPPAEAEADARMEEETEPPAPAPAAAAAAADADDDGAVFFALRRTRSPPTAAELEVTMAARGVPAAVHQVPFYGWPADAPPRGVVLAGRVIKVPTAAVSELAPLSRRRRSSPGSDGAAAGGGGAGAWVEAAEAWRRSCRDSGGSAAAGAGAATNGGGGGLWALRPLRPPPSRWQIRAWLGPGTSVHRGTGDDGGGTSGANGSGSPVPSVPPVAVASTPAADRVTHPASANPAKHPHPAPPPPSPFQPGAGLRLSLRGPALAAAAAAHEDPAAADARLDAWWGWAVQVEIQLTHGLKATGYSFK
jgi:hypothetical protein